LTAPQPDRGTRTDGTHHQGFSLIPADSYFKSIWAAGKERVDSVERLPSAFLQNGIGSPV
jgi:hypothetical protein